jgi:hypothetical protein
MGDMITTFSNMQNIITLIKNYQKSPKDKVGSYAFGVYQG